MSYKMKCVIIDDEIHAIELLEDYISNIPNLEVLKTYTDPIIALGDISLEDDISFIFLDIDMPRMTGIELGGALRDKSKYLVFTTAHSKFALNAFDVYADQFLLKPITLRKFALTINQLLNNKPIYREEKLPADHKNDEFFITTDQKNKLLKINTREIIAIEGLDNYVTLHTINGPVIAYFTMKELEAKFSKDDSFFRVQKSFIVCRNYIHHVHGHMIHCTNGLAVPIGIKYKKEFLDYLSSKTLRSGRK